MFWTTTTQITPIRSRSIQTSAVIYSPSPVAEQPRAVRPVGLGQDRRANPTLGFVGMLVEESGLLLEQMASQRAMSAQLRATMDSVTFCTSAAIVLGR